MKLSLSQTFLPLVIKCIEGKDNYNNNKASIRSIWIGHLHDDIFLLFGVGLGFWVYSIFGYLFQVFSIFMLKIGYKVFPHDQLWV